MGILTDGTPCARVFRWVIRLGDLVRGGKHVGGVIIPDSLRGIRGEDVSGRVVLADRGRNGFGVVSGARYSAGGLRLGASVALTWRLRRQGSFL